MTDARPNQDVLITEVPPALRTERLSTNATRRRRAARVACGSLALITAFSSGYALAFAKTQFTTRINKGLVNALEVVGQTLFGSAVFGTRVIPNEPIFPAGAVQIDIASDTKIAAAIGVFTPSDPIQPGDPCRKFAQIEIKQGGAVLAVDLDAAPEGFSPTIEFKSLAAFAPDLNRCRAPQPPGDVNSTE